MFLFFFIALAFITNSVKEGILKAFKNEAATKYEKVFVKLYTGNPGEAGGTNAAGETTRKEVGAFTGTTLLKNSAAIKWAAVSTAETIKYVGFWTEAAGGTFLGYTAVETEKTVAIGDNLEIPIEGFSWAVA